MLKEKVSELLCKIQKVFGQLLIYFITCYPQVGSPKPVMSSSPRKRLDTVEADGGPYHSSNSSESADSCNEEPHLDSTDLLSLVLSFSLRHGLSNVAMSDLVELLNLVCRSSCDMPPTKYLMMKSISSRYERRSFHYYCLNEKCRAYAKADQNACRYCGTAFSSKKAKKEGCFFIHLPLGDQLWDLLETGYISKNIIVGERQASHISDIVDGELYKKHGLLGNGGDSALSISWNFDGLLVHETSGASAWPILAAINELKPEVRKDQMLMCGIWYGKSKPLWSTMCQPFVDDLATLSTEGLKWSHPTDGEKVTRVVPLLTMCDSPARCMVQAIHQFNGEYGCTWCLQMGTRVATGNGFCRAYPHEADVPQRTHQSLLRHGRRVLNSAERHCKGVTSVSPLHLLPPCVELDLVNCFPVDYMHCVLLGVTRQMFALWFEPGDEPYTIRRSLKEVDDDLCKIQPPDDVSRLPRSLTSFRKWTATEWRNWLLYYSVPLLRGILPDRYLRHWTLLTSAVFQLLNERISLNMVDDAEMKLGEFVSDIARLYGPEQMSYNVHTLLHLANSVRKCGPLWATSMFPFEGFNRVLLKFCHGTNHMAQQMADSFLLLRIVSAQQEQRRLDGDNEGVERLVSRWLRGYTLGERAEKSRDGVVSLGAPSHRKLTADEASLLAVSGLTRSSECVDARSYGRAVLHGRITCSSAYGASLKRNSYTINTVRGVCTVKHILFTGAGEDVQCHVLCLKCETEPLLPNVEHIFKFRQTSTMLAMAPSSILGNAVVARSTRNGMVCCLQPNRREKD